MRDFFIGWLEKLIGVFVVLLGIGVVGGAIAASSEAGILGFIGVLFAGAIYVTLMAGFMYVGLGIYHNTKRTADALERQTGVNT